MNTEFDAHFEQIQTLKWMPWVGHHFSSIPQARRMLVVGESHYHHGTDESIASCNDVQLTRDVIIDMAVDRNYYGTKIFPNLHRALFRNDEFATAPFWHNIAFYNFIQRPMHTNHERPSYNEFYESWRTFFSLLPVLKPSICLFIGTSAANSLMHALADSTELTCSEVHWEDYISNAYAKSATLSYADGTSCQLIFIRHTSQMFSWDKWNAYISKRLPEQLNWLNAQFSAPSSN